jgi:hypothetical protein
MVKLCLYGKAGTVFQEKTGFGTHLKVAINHFLLQMNVVVGGPSTEKIFGLKGSLPAT